MEGQKVGEPQSSSFLGHSGGTVIKWEGLPILLRMIFLELQKPAPNLARFSKCPQKSSSVSRHTDSGEGKKKSCPDLKLCRENCQEAQWWGLALSDGDRSHRFKVCKSSGGGWCTLSHSQWSFHSIPAANQLEGLEEKYLSVIMPYLAPVFRPVLMFGYILRAQEVQTACTHTCVTDLLFSRLYVQVSKSFSEKQSARWFDFP